MILVVKGKNYKRLAAKTLSVIGLIVMFYAYYTHMSDKFQGMNNTLVKKLDIEGKNKKINLARVLEKLIYKEAETAVDLLGQNNIRSVRIIEKKLFIVCDYDTDIEPLLIRYGVQAMMKQTAQDIKIAIDLKFIVESRYET
ncbi:MAG: hypothetical protein KAQ94_05095 [Arcobacteraceae bacterium]|nr:hypothetical protein [Arcobacteraceae bacterium]